MIQALRSGEAREKWSWTDGKPKLPGGKGRPEIRCSPLGTEAKWGRDGSGEERRGLNFKRDTIIRTHKVATHILETETHVFMDMHMPQPRRLAPKDTQKQPHSYSEAVYTPHTVTCSVSSPWPCPVRGATAKPLASIGRQESKCYPKAGSLG